MGRPVRDATRPAFCDACFSGDYPIGLTDEINRSTRSPRQLTLLAETG
jgi:amidophosphoribosyltransferase